MKIDFARGEKRKSQIFSPAQLDFRQLGKGDGSSSGGKFPCIQGRKTREINGNRVNPCFEYGLKKKYLVADTRGAKNEVFRLEFFFYPRGSNNIRITFLIRWLIEIILTWSGNFQMILNLETIFIRHLEIILIFLIFSDLLWSIVTIQAKFDLLIAILFKESIDDIQKYIKCVSDVELNFLQ